MVSKIKKTLYEWTIRKPFMIRRQDIDRENCSTDE